MRTNPYFTIRHGRPNYLKGGIFRLLSFFDSYARLLLEVFIRRNFGQRYFSIVSAWTVALVLAAWPFLMLQMDNMPNLKFQRFMHNPTDPEAATATMFPQYLCWYIFLAWFIWESYKRNKEIKKNLEEATDFTYSLYQGDVNDHFWSISIPGIKTDIRVIECYLEPALFFIAGLFLHVIGQKLGGLLIIASISYAATYMYDYFWGDHFFLNYIDEMLCNEETERVLIDNAPASKTRGVEMRGKLPDSMDVRRKIVSLMMDEDQVLKVE